MFVVSGVAWGVALALLLSAWVTLIYLVAGPEPFHENGTTYGETVGVYLATGMGMGVLFGVLRPWIRGPWTASAFGFVAGCGFFSMISLATGSYDPLAVLISAALLGPAVGWKYWQIFG